MHPPQQGSLFDDDPAQPPRINRDAFAAAIDHQLDEHSWITHVPGFVSGHQELIAQLSAAADWEQRRRWMFTRMVDEPRLTAEYRDIDSAPALLAEIAAELGKQYGVRYDRVWMNWYRDHHDGTGWHADRPANLAPTATVPVVTLGATRRFLIRPTGGGRSFAFTPAGGDLLVMRGRCQRDWQHCIPKQKPATGARMSLNYSSTNQAIGPTGRARTR